MRIPENVLVILKIIEDAGGEAYVVGGCVRDYIYGKAPKDWDVTTSLEPDEIIGLFSDKYPVLPTGLQHGTVTIMIGGEGYEITTYRTDGEYEDGRHPSKVVFVKSLEEDLARRDFTMNAIAYSPVHGFKDPYNGRDDIRDGIIRAVGSPLQRFEEDALRMMRAVRFSAQLGFDIEKETWNGIISKKTNILNVSSERIHDELCKILMSNHPHYVKKLYDCGVLDYILPELSCMFVLEQNHPWHIYNAGEHTMKALEEVAAIKTDINDISVRMAVMLHDVGKSVTKTTDENGIDHFHGHAIHSASMTDCILKRLKFPNKIRYEVIKLVLAHDVPVLCSKKAVRRYVAKNQLNTEELFYKSLLVKYADNCAQNKVMSNVRIEELEIIPRLYEEIKDCPFSVKDLAVDGHDMMALGFYGVEIGEVLDKLVEEVLENPDLNTKEVLLEMAKNMKK